MKNAAVEQYLREQTGGITPKDWLQKDYPITMAGQFRLLLESSDVVFIIGDYDVDGISASYILKKGIQAIYPNKTVTVLLPDRFTDGFGINKTQIDRIIASCMQMEERGKGFHHPMVLTCDNGIAQLDAIDYLRKRAGEVSLPFQVIVTDHHLPEKDADGRMELPDADLICNPHLPDSGFSYTEYCGAGIAYKLIYELAKEKGCTIPEEQLLFFVGLATIADCVELKEENWVFARKSLDILRKAVQKRNIADRDALLSPGIRMLLSELGIIHPAQVNEQFYSFTLAPVLNAMGRLQHFGALRIFRYLDGKETTQEACKSILANNQVRKVIMNETFETLDAILTAEGKQPDKDKVLWLLLPEELSGAKEGLCGLYASKFTEKYGVPALVLVGSEKDPSVLKGSGRNVPGFSLLDYLEEQASPFLLGFGGHAEACGLSMRREEFARLLTHPEVFQIEECQSKDGLSQECPLFEDALSDMADDYAVLQREYAPFGMGFSAPRYAVEAINEKDNFHTMGEGKHFCMRKDGIKLIHFHHNPEELADPDHFYLIGSLQPNYYNGNVSYQFLAEEVADELPRELSIPLELLMEEELERE